MKILLFSGSLRTESFNKKLIHVVHNHLSNKYKHPLTIVDLKDYNLPVYDGDLEKDGLPAQVQKWCETIKNHDVIFISTPEYNSSIAGPLKNAIDWASRSKPNCLSQKSIFLLGASTGALAAVKGLTQSRIPLEALGNYVYPTTFGLPKAQEAFSENKELKDSDMQKRLTGLVDAFMDYSAKLKS